MTVNVQTSSGETKKLPPWSRILNIAIRTAHVAVIGILLGGAFFEIPLKQLLHLYPFVFATGGVLIVLEICHSRHWPYQGRGVLVLAHIGVLGLVPLCPNLRVPILLAVLALGMVGSHMPKNLRHWSLIHGRVLE